MFSAGEAAVKYLIRFIRALGDPVWVWLSVKSSVPGQHTPHVLSCAPESVTGHSSFIDISARQILPHPWVLAQGGVIHCDGPGPGVTWGRQCIQAPVTIRLALWAAHYPRIIASGITSAERGDIQISPSLGGSDLCLVRSVDCVKFSIIKFGAAKTVMMTSDKGR